MATFLFVHGAFVGGWSWKKVNALLRAAGHEVYTPTLTGLGERVHLLNPDIDLETHIQDILEVISYEDLAGVILVGHSYSGLVIASVADRVPQRLAHLVYLDAFIPQDGQSALDLFDQQDRAAIEERVQRGGEGWLLPPREQAHYGITTQVAEQLVISPRTVNNHLTSIYSKLGVSSRAAATRYAMEHHLV